DVYSDTATFILAKAVGAVGGGTEGATDASHPGNGWATLEFDFDVPKDGAAASASQFEKLFFFPLWNGTGFDGSENNSAVTTTAYDNVKYTAGDTTDTCANGILDGDETDIDCGGSCATCPEPVVIELNGSESWESYINAFTLDDVYQFGFAPSGPESLKTEVVTDGVKFFPNFDVWDENDATPQNGNPAWNTDWFSAPSETSKKLEANLYITDNTLIGKDITFNGTIPENTLVNTYEVRVFIKTLNGGFADTGASDVKILTASETGTFSLNVSREASLGATYIQYGFAVYGECADPITEFVLGNVKFSSETLGVASNELNTFKVYPNPTLGDWTVKAQNTIQAIQVYDILGKEVFASRPNNTEAIISTDALRTGVYFAKVTSNNVEKTVKLIKQ
ncbi:T9SS type A sorting domain-containing protein, partial [Flavobacteriaceae bacterium]|nr:T9SS type A sorting domain-containing protein [Flavobacteriaceae bacterium]